MKSVLKYKPCLNCIHIDVDSDIEETSFLVLLNAIRHVNEVCIVVQNQDCLKLFTKILWSSNVHAKQIGGEKLTLRVGLGNTTSPGIVALFIDAIAWNKRIKRWNTIILEVYNISREDNTTLLEAISLSGWRCIDKLITSHNEYQSLSLDALESLSKIPCVTIHNFYSFKTYGLLNHPRTSILQCATCIIENCDVNDKIGTANHLMFISEWCNRVNTYKIKKFCTDTSLFDNGMMMQFYLNILRNKKIVIIGTVLLFPEIIPIMRHLCKHLTSLRIGIETRNYDNYEVVICGEIISRCLANEPRFIYFSDHPSARYLKTLDIPKLLEPLRLKYPLLYDLWNMIQFPIKLQNHRQYQEEIVDLRQV